VLLPNAYKGRHRISLTAPTNIYTKSLSFEILERPFVDILAFILMLEQELN
jgi:hypothetical protein